MTVAVQLHELTRLIRSKNAGPFTLTFDIIFVDDEAYQRVLEAEVISPASISELYGVREADVTVYACAPARAIKVSFPRSISSGDPLDADVFGCQQHAPLVELVV
jgi:hypothetical protein